MALAVCICLFGYAQREDSVASGRVKHTIEIQERIQRIVRTALNVESSLRGYITTGDDHSLNQYRNARSAMPELLDGLTMLVAGDAGEGGRVKDIKVVTGETLAQIDRLLLVLHERVNIPADTLERQRQTSTLADEIDQWYRELDLMRASEDRLLNSRIDMNYATKQVFNWAFSAIVFLGVAGGLLAIRLFATGITRRMQVLETNAVRLEQGVPLLLLGGGNDEIGRLGAAMERASRLLAERSERLTLALKAARIAIWEMDLSSQLIRYEGEREFLDSTNYLIDALPATKDAFYGFIDPQDRAQAQQQFTDALANDTEYHGEYRIVSGGADVRWMKVVARHYSEGHAPSTFLGVLMDVTKRKQNDEARSSQARELATSDRKLLEQTRLLQCVLDDMGDGVIAADMNGNFLLFNPAAKKMMGIGAMETTTEQWSKQYGIFLPDMTTLYPASDLPLARALLGDSVDGEELFIRNANLPEGVWLSGTARPLKDEGGMWGGVVVFSDITERKRERALRAAKEEAENANKAKNEFLSRMSHELRTPLNAIIGFSQVLEMTETSEKNRPRIGHILKAGRHLLGLIEEVLDISRMEARLLTLSLEPVLVDEAIEQAVDLVNPIAANAGVRLETTVSAATALYVSADRQRTQQILLNLLSNAIKYNSPGGAVTISAEVVSGKMRVNVTDTGIGIAEDFFPRLFQPFERLGATQTAVEGTGLGLALSKGLAEAMGGTIGVKSVVGRGTTFWLELPQAESLSRTVLRESAPVPERPIQNDSSLTVLYVEDNLSNVRLMEDIVAIRSGIKLITAMQGRIGLTLAREHRPELIFLDLHLPDMPGHEVLARLKSDPRTSMIPVVIISADATPGQVKRLLDAGVQEYLTKPIDMKHIFRVFDKHLSRPEEQLVLERQSI
jgi:signal transduction histidine kinase/CheY-like chemotaxis protein/CHASE3 domain sensor protein